MTQADIRPSKSRANKRCVNLLSLVLKLIRLPRCSALRSCLVILELVELLHDPFKRGAHATVCFFNGIAGGFVWRRIWADDTRVGDRARRKTARWHDFYHCAGWRG